MLYSQSLLFKKRALGIIWVAAHCHKRLKKDQVAQTNVSSSVDKILLDEVPVVTYRILGYLLLGVVRIYSKKVDYLFHDCHDVLNNINDFVTSKKANVHVEAMCAPYHSITLPERFELDAFDLEILEDVSGGNVRPHEEIMLKDAWKNEGSGHYSFEKYHGEEDAAPFETLPAAYTPVKDVCSPHPMDGDEVPSPSPNLSNLGASMEKFRGKRFSSEECLDPMMLVEAEEEPHLVRPFGEEHQTAREQIKIVDTKMFFGAEKEPLDITRSFHGEQHTDAEKIECPEMISPESGNHQLSKQNRPVSITIDVTPQSKFPDAPGATTPEFIVVHTPATKECDKVSRKRRCFYDDFIVLPNQLLKQQIDNSTGLVCKRRKAPHTALCTWKASQISNLPLSFLEPLLPGISPELRSLFCKMKINTPERVEHPTVHSSLDLTANARSTPVVEAPENANVLVSPTIQKSPDQTDLAPSTPVTHSTSVRLHEVPEISYSGRVGLASPSESIHKKLSPSEDQEFDISSLNEEVNSGEGDKQEIDGWSVRTRAVVRYLHKNFLSGKKKRGNGVVNLLQVLKGKNRKESARVFFEILYKNKLPAVPVDVCCCVWRWVIEALELELELEVLKTGGYVDVKQDDGNGDILVLKTPKFK